MQSSMRKLLGKQPQPARDGKRGSGETNDRHDRHDRHDSAPRPTAAFPGHAASPREASFQVGVPIEALDRSPDGRSAVLAGRHVLKTVRIDADAASGTLAMHETFDLRAVITGQAAPRAGAPYAPYAPYAPSHGLHGLHGLPLGQSVAERLAIRDVCWGRGRFDTHVFTACLGGNIFQYDMARLGARAAGHPAPAGAPGGPDVVQMKEDSRQINTLDLSPHSDVYLLSGSQDGSVRLFDMHTTVSRGGSSTYRGAKRFKCNSDVRDVQWSPTDCFVFACCTDQGQILKWDIRRPAAPVLRITAHEKSCPTISWHPDGMHLISGGSDHLCHVWDMSDTADKRQKPKYSLQTPASVAAVAWRPGQWSASLGGLRAAQVAVSYDAGTSKRPGAGVEAVHVWDLARPTIPYRTIERRFDQSPAALLWKDAEFLWSGGEDGLFCQNDVAYAARPVDRTAMSTLAFSSGGDVLTFLDERPPGSLSTMLAGLAKDVTPSNMAHARRGDTRRPGSVGNAPPGPPRQRFVSQSESEDEVVHSFLLPRRRRRRTTSPSARLQRSNSLPSGDRSTPPGQQDAVHAKTRSTNHKASTGAGKDARNPVINLDDVLASTGAYRPQQIMAIGRVPAAADRETYGYMAAIYLETLEHGLPPVRRDGQLVPLPERVAGILETYALAAEHVRQYRLAQVWRIVAFAMELLLARRGRYHQHKRMTPGATDAADATGEGTGDGTVRRKKSSVAPVPVRSLLTEEIESTSNMPTPLARPVPDMPITSLSSGYEFQTQGHDDTSPANSFALPPAQYKAYLATQPPRRHLDSEPVSETSQTSQTSQTSETSQASQASQASQTGGYDFYDTEAMAHAIDVPGANGRTAPTEHVRNDDDDDDDDDEEEADAEAEGHTRAGLLRQASSGSAGLRMFEISQTDTSPVEREQEPEKKEQEKKEKNENEREPPPRGDRPLASSVGSTRVLRLNRAVMSMAASVSPSAEQLLSLSATVPRDTYYPSATSATSAASMGASTGSANAHARPLLQRNASSRLDAVSIATSEESEEDSDDAAEIKGQHARMTDRDYLPWPHDPPFPFAFKGDDEPTLSDDGNGPGRRRAADFFTHNAALNPYVIVARALAFEVRTSPLNASAMVLLLKPLLPDDVVDALQARAVLRQHHARLTGMKLFLEAALLRKLCVAGWPAHMTVSFPPGARSSDMAEMARWGAGTSLAGMAAYTALTAPAQKGVAAAYLCAACKKPRELERDPTSVNVGGLGRGHASTNTNGEADDSVWTCSRCRSVAAPCAVCGHRQVSALADDDVVAPEAGSSAPGHTNAVLSTWWYCVGCAHGGHLTCLESWHAAAGASDDFDASDADELDAAFSGGCCPLDGCGHACLPGRWRADANVQRSDDLARALGSALSTTNVPGAGAGASDARPDGHDVGPSRAVDVVRESLGVLGTSPGRTGFAYTGETREPREPRERRKSVKFASDGVS